MFTIFKVRDNLTSYADPGWYKHPQGLINAKHNKDHMHDGMKMKNTMIDPSNMREMQHDMSSTNHGMSNMNDMKKFLHAELSRESWFSQEEDKLESHNQQGNWMQSKPEDSMGHMHGDHSIKKGNMQGMSREMNMSNQTEGH